jgi:cysteine desulfurase/selenocysteine lyase
MCGVYSCCTTEGINLVASTFGRKFLAPGDEIIITNMEHHSNIVPWQMLCEEKDLQLKVLPLTDDGEVKWEVLDSMISSRTKIVSVVHASNTLGTINPVAEITKKAHSVGAIMVIDGAQAAAHLDIDVQKLNCDFYAFSSHKMYGPTGVGVLYGKRKWLEKIPPYQGGGEMIKEVSLEKTTYSDIPHKFEAGTPNIADVVAFHAAIDFIEQMGKKTIQKHEEHLTNYAQSRLGSIDGLRIIGTSSNKVGVVSFVVAGVHHFDLGVMLDAKGIAVRTGHHCTQPLMDCYGIEGTVRASFSVYNTTSEVDVLVDSLQAIVTKLRG